MRNKGVVVVLGILITLLCLYYLSFTFVSRGVQQDAVNYATDQQGALNLSKKQRYLDSVWSLPVYNLFGLEYTYKEVKENELSQGLDLQGGMHLVLEVSPLDIVRGLSGNNQDPAFIAALQTARERYKTSNANFADLFYAAFKEANPDRTLASMFVSTANRGRVNLGDSDETVVKFLKEEIERAFDRSFTILKTRIDKFGTSQPNIQRLQGSGRIQVEIPGADNPQRVRKLLSGVARLEFWDVVEYDDPQLQQSLMAVNQMLLKEQTAARAQGTTAEKTTTKVSTEAKTDTTQSALEAQLAKAASDTTGNTLDSLRNLTVSPLFALSNPGIPFLYAVKDTAEINRLLKREDVRAMIPRTIGFFWDVKPEPDITPGVDDLRLNFINLGRSGKPLLSGEVINDARLDYDQFARPAVSMTMNATGSRVWAKVTATAASKSPQGRIAIVLDNYVYTAPTVQGEIPNGNSQITGNFDVEEAKDLANVLKAGSLPAPTRIVEEAYIGPSLGQMAQNQGLISSAAGLILVVIFMVIYYAKGGFIANLALLFNIFFILGILAQLNAALTLPGIAGIVLTMGMAVDANVLIYERIREELRHGKKLREAIKLGYQRAFSAIFDSNLTTFLTGMFLYIFGLGPLKGFAIVLMIGIGTSFFSAVYISRVIIEWMVRKGDEAKLTFETGISWTVPKDMVIDFISLRKRAYIFSSVVILIGFILIALQGLNLGVDFKGGRSFVVAFSQPVEATQLKSSLSGGFENAGTEVKNYGGNNVMKVTTSYLVEDESEAADEKVKSALIKGLESTTGKKYTENDRQLDDQHFTIPSTSKVGATIADDIKSSAFTAGGLSILSIFLYILIRFRKWQFSTGAIVALVHDMLFTFSAFAIARVVGFPLEIDQVFVAAILTIIGYSINDTVIIFDRIREYMKQGTSHERNYIFNSAITSTLSRTIVTSSTVLIVVIVLLFFGGETLRGFSFAMVVGVIIGTYSSIFIASPLVIDLDPKGSAHIKA
ncbi:MAG: protein translocase subunit SecDF [Cyclobacteriaceae bacterium]|nr:protein translocase subunit SecDF [Cyclobacteriaceae bacterium]